MIKLINAVDSDRKHISQGKFCPVLVNGVPTRALIDSGNLAGTCISYSFACKLGLKKDDFTRKNMVFGTAKKGASLTVLGVPKKPVGLRFGGLAKEYHLKPYVIKELTSDINISLDFLEQHKIDQIHSQHCLKVQGKLVRLFDRRGPLPGIVEEDTPGAVYIDSDTPEVLAEVTNERVARKETTEVYLEKDVVIPANAAKYIKLRVPKVQRRTEDNGSIGRLGLIQLSIAINFPRQNSPWYTE